MAELDDAGDGGTPSLDFVLFTLIPSHVHSPRRIKVLLNNYATNVRMTRSRLPGAWPVRAREIARLTAFQTEFPDFAADLRYEPRLPRYLLNGGAPASETVSDLLGGQPGSADLLGGRKRTRGRGLAQRPPRCAKRRGARPNPCLASPG